MPKNEYEHPLRAADVFNRAGAFPPVDDGQFELVCDSCGQRQTLLDATLEPGDDAHDITAYRCINGCAVIAVTGIPTEIPFPGSARFRLGDLCIQAHVSGGLRMYVPPAEPPEKSN